MAYHGSWLELGRALGAVLLLWSPCSGAPSVVAEPSPVASADPPRESSQMDIPLWPGQSRNLTLALPARSQLPTRPAFVVLRGGAYASSSGSGAGSAAWLAAHGIVATEVPYRTGNGGAYPGCYADAARAVRLLRSRASELGIDPQRIGVLGYSAGGHLASLLSTQPELFRDPADDLASRVSAGPDLVTLAYPLISMVEQYSPGAFVGSVENFFGREASLSERRAFSNELHVTSSHPPVFIWTTREDTLVPWTHSQLFASACTSSGVPVQLELFEHGPHGLGLALGRGDETGTWTSRWLVWLHAQWGEF